MPKVPIISTLMSAVSIVSILNLSLVPGADRRVALDWPPQTWASVLALAYTASSLAAGTIFLVDNLKAGRLLVGLLALLGSAVVPAFSLSALSMGRGIVLVGDLTILREWFAGLSIASILVMVCYLAQSVGDRAERT